MVPQVEVAPQRTLNLQSDRPDDKSSPPPAEEVQP
jgi:hypothetical protein